MVPRLRRGRLAGVSLGLVANARGMQTFTFRVFRVLKLCKHCIAMLRGLGLASWTGWDSPVPGLALDGPSRAVTAARRGPGQPLGSGLPAALKKSYDLAETDFERRREQQEPHLYLLIARARPTSSVDVARCIGRV